MSQRIYLCCLSGWAIRHPGSLVLHRILVIDNLLENTNCTSLTWSFCVKYQNITELTSSHGCSILLHLSPISQSTCLHFQRGSMESLSGFLITCVTLDALLLSCSGNFPRTSILLQKCWKGMGFPWLLLNGIYCKVTIWSKGICADWLWAIAGQSENQVLDGSENSCSDMGQ